jgi:hypothetical protein
LILSSSLSGSFGEIVGAGAEAACAQAGKGTAAPKQQAKTNKSLPSLRTMRSRMVDSPLLMPASLAEEP